MERKDPGDLVGQTFEQLPSGRQRHEHRKERPSVHGQRDLGLPEERRREPVTEHAGRDVSVLGDRSLGPIPELLGSTHHEHPLSLAGIRGPTEEPRRPPVLPYSQLDEIAGEERGE